jgi:protease-4
MGSLAASGGYWISATADQIWASPTTLTGSIGIFGFIPTLEKTLARFGINSDGVGTTPLAGSASIERGISPLYGSLIQTVIDSGYQQFLETVAKGRNMTVDEVNEVAQGRIWSGEKAKELGLVDHLGDLDDAVKAAGELAEIDEYTVWYVEPEESFKDKIVRGMMTEFGGIAYQSDPVSKVYQKIRQDLKFLTQLNDPHNAYVICTSCPLEQ